MTAKVIDGKAFAAGVRAQVATEVAKLKADKKSAGQAMYLLPEVKEPVTFLRWFAGCATL